MQLHVPALPDLSYGGRERPTNSRSQRGRHRIQSLDNVSVIGDLLDGKYSVLLHETGMQAHAIREAHASVPPPPRAQTHTLRPTEIGFSLTKMHRTNGQM